MRSLIKEENWIGLDWYLDHLHFPLGMFEDGHDEPVKYKLSDTTIYELDLILFEGIHSFCIAHWVSRLFTKLYTSELYIYHD